MTLSIVVPVFNARVYLENMIASVLATTKSNFELILIDDCSDTPTREFVKNLTSDTVPIHFILNVEHKWTNYNWNLGVILAEGDYVAVLNSDIVLSDGWDLELISLLADCTIACPLTIKDGEDESGNKRTFVQALHPLVKQIDPNMINGAAYMFKKVDQHSMFPIPPELKHWCGDNWIADRANEIRGVKFADKAFIKHGISASASTLRPFDYKVRILADLEAYEHISDRDMKPIKDTIHL